MIVIAFIPCLSTPYLHNKMSSLPVTLALEEVEKDSEEKLRGE